MKIHTITSRSHVVTYEELPAPARLVADYLAQDYEIDFSVVTHFEPCVAITLSTDVIGAKFVVTAGGLIRTFPSLRLLAIHALDCVEGFYKSRNYRVQIGSRYFPGSQALWKQIETALTLDEFRKGKIG